MRTNDFTNFFKKLIIAAQQVVIEAGVVTYVYGKIPNLRNSLNIIERLYLNMEFLQKIVNRLLKAKNKK